MNVTIFWDIAPCSPYVNRRFGGTYHLYLQGRKSVMEGTSLQQVHIRTTRRYIPEVGNIQNTYCILLGIGMIAWFLELKPFLHFECISTDNTGFCSVLACKLNVLLFCLVWLYTITLPTVIIRGPSYESGICSIILGLCKRGIDCDFIRFYPIFVLTGLRTITKIPNRRYYS
jgi:hypothetical protein